jgi:hypothetical protein
MTNKQLTYGKSAIKTGFVGVPDRLSMYGQNFIDVPNMSAVDQITLINSEANQCRGWYEPVYSDNSKYLPIPPKEATAEMLYNDNCFLDKELAYFYPYIEFIFEDYSSELKFFETSSLAKTYMEQNNIKY